MTEQESIIAKAKAFEIAIALTGADHTWLQANEKNDVIINDPLFITTKRVFQILTEKSLFDVDNRVRVYRGTTVKENKRGQV